MHETEANRELMLDFYNQRRLRQLGGGESHWYDMNIIMSAYSNPCVEITMTSSGLCTLGGNPLVKFNKFNFKF